MAEFSTTKTGQAPPERGELVHGDAWRRITVRGRAAYERADDPGICPPAGSGLAATRTMS